MQAPAPGDGNDRLRVLAYLDRKPGRDLATQIAAAIEADGGEAGATD